VVKLTEFKKSNITLGLGSILDFLQIPLWDACCFRTEQID